MTHNRPIKKLGEIAQIKTGKKDANFGTSDGKYLFFTCGEKILRAPDYSFDTEAILVAGNGDVGACKYYKGKFEAYQRTYVIDKFGNNDPFYLFYYLNGFLGKKAKEQMLGSAIPYIKLGMLQNFEIPLPPLATQQLIVAKLDETFAQIDEAIATTQANIDQTDELRKSVLDKVFEEGEWEKVRLNDICEKITDGSHNPPKGIDGGDYKMIASRNIESGVLSFDGCRFLTKEDFDSENKRTDVQTGDVLLSIVGTIGKVYVILESDGKFVMQRSLAVIKGKRNIINSYFLATFFKSPVFQKYINDNAKGAAQKGIYLNSLKELQIPLPPLTKQQEIVSYLDHVFAQSSQLKEQYQKKLVELKELKASVLQSAFEGELV